MSAWMLASPFASSRQREQASVLGMWVFIGQEILFFGGLFLAYTVARYAYPETFVAAHRKLDVTLGAINTAVLLFSSYTAALSVWAARRARMRIQRALMLITALLGCAFLIVKGFEYAEKIHAGLLPGALYTAKSLPGRPELFFGLYFGLTGLHALHVLIGVGLFLWYGLAFGWTRDREATLNTTHNLALYWHFVDLVWLYVFPLMYLIQ
jgi:cytochrome c oxidase subunit 3